MKLMGNTDIEDCLLRLDKLTQEEARMASAELLKMTRDVDRKVMGVDNSVKSVEGKVEDVRSDMHDVGNKVQGVEGKVQDVRSDVQDVDHRVQTIGNNISSRVQGVDDKSMQVNRSLSLQSLLLVLSTHTSS
jgi:archaellum component FlaC